MKRTLRAGPFVFRDPVLLCGVLYGLLWFDASGFLRIGLWAAFLHECGHVAAYLAMLHEMPTLEVNMTGFCMRTRGRALMPQQTFWLAAAGPLTNALLAALWAGKLSDAATIRGSAFLAANLLTGSTFCPSRRWMGRRWRRRCGSWHTAKRRIAIPREIR